MEHGRRAGAVLTATIRTVAETGSTNVDMLALARDGVEEGLWLRAERQTAGRGRQGRAWVSPSGNLYASTIVRLRATDPPPATLALVAAVVLAEVVGAHLGHPRESGDPAPADNQVSGAGKMIPCVRVSDRLRLKWPNDLLLDGAKLSGILLERADQAVVIGFGVNLAHHPELPDRATTSLAAHKVIVKPAAFAESLAGAFAAWLARWRSEGFAPIRICWLALAHPEGAPLVARLPDGSSAEGFFGGLDADGALRLVLADGVVRVIHAADIFTR